MKDLTFTLLQYDIAWENVEANLAFLEQQLSQVPEESHILVLPEMFATGFTMQPQNVAQTMDGRIVQWMRKHAIACRKIITGSVVIAENGHYYNRLVWMLPNGAYHTYDKKHLFSFAGENKHYLHGNTRKIVSVNGWKICLNICYDLRFPVWNRQHPDADQQYDVLLYVANWPERRSYPWQALLKARAIENMAYVVAVNRVGKDANGINHSGDSAIIDPLGTVIWTLANDVCMHTRTLHYRDVVSAREQFGFLNDIDNYMLL